MKTMIHIDQSDIEALHAHSTDALRTVPGTERVVGTQRREPAEDEGLTHRAQQFRRGRVEPVALGYHRSSR